MQDIEISDKWRWCEYIAFRGLWRVAYARVHESDITDTELQVGKFLLPRQAEVAEYANDEERYWHIGEDDVSGVLDFFRSFSLSLSLSSLVLLIIRCNTRRCHTASVHMFRKILITQIPAPWRLPSMFRGAGVRGHKYVVWVGPVYYMPPSRSGLQRYGA